MNNWLNVHHPVPEGREEEECNTLNIPASREGRLDEFREGDPVFIYETGGPLEVPIGDTMGSRVARLGFGRRGIIAVGCIVFPFIRERWTWNGVEYCGYFKLRFNGGEFVSLATIKNGIGPFQTRIRGGIRQLSDREADVLRRLTKSDVRK